MVTVVTVIFRCRVSHSLYTQSSLSPSETLRTPSLAPSSLLPPQKPLPTHNRVVIFFSRLLAHSLRISYIYTVYIDYITHPIPLSTPPRPHRHLPLPTPFPLFIAHGVQSTVLSRWGMLGCGHPNRNHVHSGRFYFIPLYL